jgi:hypothetical protein
MKNPSLIKNKAKRSEMYSKFKQQKSKMKKKVREERKAKNAELGDEAPVMV